MSLAPIMVGTMKFPNGRAPIPQSNLWVGTTGVKSPDSVSMQVSGPIGVTPPALPEATGFPRECAYKPQMARPSEALKMRVVLRSRWRLKEA